MSILLTFLTLFIIFGMPLGAVLILTWYIYYLLRNISLFSSFVNEMLFLHNIALIGNSFSPRALIYYCPSTVRQSLKPEQMLDDIILQEMGSDIIMK